MVRRLIWLLGGVGLLGCFLVGGCSRGVDPWKGIDPNQKRVVTTIAPLASFVRAVGGDRVAVKCLCTTSGPHHYEPAPADLRMVSRADLLFAVGLTLDESFAEQLTRQSENPKLRYVLLGTALKRNLLRSLDAPIKHGDHEHTGYDPHVWLGIPQAQGMVEKIASELSVIDPQGADAYKKNAAAFQKSLGVLQSWGREALARKRPKPDAKLRLITQHDSLRYFADSFDLDVAGVVQLVAGDEATLRHRQELEKLCLEAQKQGNPIRILATEPQFQERSAARSLREELAARGVELELVEIDPLETADEAELVEQGGTWYETQMRKNLTALVDKLP
jgi:ABC-type Zn uptake system ZnuABC Zn-binding protein ZnuA